MSSLDDPALRDTRLTALCYINVYNWVQYTLQNYFRLTPVSIIRVFSKEHFILAFQKYLQFFVHYFDFSTKIPTATFAQSDLLRKTRKQTLQRHNLRH